MSLRISALALLVALSPAAAAKDQSSSNFEIVSLSNRADLISGGDALLEVRVPKNVGLHRVTLWLNGREVTGAFKANAAARTLRGVVKGLVEGDNEFVADADGRGRRPAKRGFAADVCRWPGRQAAAVGTEVAAGPGWPRRRRR